MSIWDKLAAATAELSLAGQIAARLGGAGGHHGVARAAFDEAVRNRPGRIVTLRQKTRLLADSRKKN